MNMVRGKEKAKAMDFLSQRMSTLSFHKILHVLSQVFLMLFLRIGMGWGWYKLSQLRIRMRCWNFVLRQVVTVTRLQHAEIKDSPFCYTCAARGQLKSQSGRKFYSSAALTTAQVYNPNTCNSQEYIKHQKYKQIWHGMKSTKHKDFTVILQ